MHSFLSSQVIYEGKSNKYFRLLCYLTKSLWVCEAKALCTHLCTRQHLPLPECALIALGKRGDHCVSTLQLMPQLPEYTHGMPASIPAICEPGGERRRTQAKLQQDLVLQRYGGPIRLSARDCSWTQKSLRGPYRQQACIDGSRFLPYYSRISIIVPSWWRP